MSGRAVTVLVLVLMGTGVVEAAAQTSLYGVRGLGHPGRMASARGRGLGGGLAALDPSSPVNPASIAGLGAMSVQLMSETDLRQYQVGAVSVDGLSSTRFPLAQLGGRIGSTALSFALSYAQYTERSYDLTNADTIEIRGEPVGFEERTTSRGGMSDLRLALGYRIGTRLRVGAAAHLLTGSAKLTFLREFADSAYRPYRVETDEALDGLGVSAGVVWAAASRLTVGFAARSDTRADITVDSAVVGSVDLPVTLVGGIQLAPARPLRWSATVTWQSWGSADADLDASAFDTWAIGTGLELGGPETGVSRFPLRLGYRYATLPVSPTEEQPTEASFSAGVGAVFAGGRGLMDLAVERVYRNGAGARETAWQLSWMVTVRP
jgi:hypothetical protein